MFENVTIVSPFLERCQQKILRPKGLATLTAKASEGWHTLQDARALSESDLPRQASWIAVALHRFSLMIMGLPLMRRRHKHFRKLIGKSKDVGNAQPPRRG